VLLVGSLSLAVGYLNADLEQWFGWVPDEEWVHWPRRVLYKLATSTDVPLVQATSAGAACLLLRIGKTQSNTEAGAS
jgi:hypothetical protein